MPNSLIIPNQTESIDKYFFVSQFLNSSEFDKVTLEQICDELNIRYSSSQPKTKIVDELITICGDSEHARQIVIQKYLTRSKTWVQLKLATPKTIPLCKNAADLVISTGTEDWYGPIDCPDDDPDVKWYLRPILFRHWEQKSNSSEFVEQKVRWLCAARVLAPTISLHWLGFSHAEESDYADRPRQFAYWYHVPTLMNEIIRLTEAQVYEFNSLDFVLHQLWDQYRYNDDYDWTDRRIRAESGGVSLNARAGSAVAELGKDEIKGIKGLANTIRRSVQDELRTKFKIFIPEPEHFDEIILRTLLREYGTLSYEFSIEIDEEKFLRTHCYFGLKPDSSTADSFTHFHIFVSWHNDIDFLKRIIQHLDVSHIPHGQARQNTLL